MIPTLIADQILSRRVSVAVRERSDRVAGTTTLSPATSINQTNRPTEHTEYTETQSASVCSVCSVGKSYE